MSGYRDRSDFEIFGEDTKPTRAQWAIAVAAIVAGLWMAIGGIADAAGGPAWLRSLNFGIAPLGLVEFLMGYTYIVRARVNAEDERYSPRALRWFASFFFLFGAALIGIGVYSHFQGA